MERELTLDLQAQDIRSENTRSEAPKCSPRFSTAGRTKTLGVADLHTTVVVVEGVGNGAIREGSIWNPNFEASAKYRCVGRPA